MFPGFLYGQVMEEFERLKQEPSLGMEWAAVIFLLDRFKSSRLGPARLVARNEGLVVPDESAWEAASAPGGGLCHGFKKFFGPDYVTSKCDYHIILQAFDMFHDKIRCTYVCCFFFHSKYIMQFVGGESKGCYCDSRSESPSLLLVGPPLKSRCIFKFSCSGQWVKLHDAEVCQPPAYLQRSKF